MGRFFNRDKKEEVPNSTQTQTPRPVAAVVSPDTALPFTMDGENPNEERDVKEELYDTYEDDEVEDTPNENNNESDAEESETEDVEESDNELKVLEEQTRITEEKIRAIKQRKLEQQKAKELQQEQAQNVTVHNIPILMTEAEFIREIMMRVRGIESWARELTLYLKERKL